jgi:hypothetical protein
MLQEKSEKDLTVRNRQQKAASKKVSAIDDDIIHRYKAGGKRCLYQCRQHKKAAC